MSQPPEEKAKQSLAYYAKAYGDSPFPPMALFSLIAAQSLRPVRLLPLFVSGNLVLAAYMNVAGYKSDAAGQTAAWSAIYALLASRRKQTLTSKVSVRGGVRAATVGLCLANVVGGGWAWMVGRRSKEEHKEL